MLVSRQSRVLLSSRPLFSQQNRQLASKPTAFNPRHLGIATDIYVPPSSSKMPSIFTSPIVYGNVLIRKLYTLGLNTVQVALFRYQSGYKPKFLLWKNRAIETYVQVNKAFANKKIDQVAPQTSIWVEKALKLRSRALPRSQRFDWELLKFNDVPKLVSVQAVMIPGRPMEHIQLIYKFDTQQRLIKLDNATGKVEKVNRDVVDYMAFVCDASTDELILTGSVLESPVDAKLPDNSDISTKATIEKMEESGDIYRSSP